MQSNLQTSDWYSYFENDVLVQCFLKIISISSKNLILYVLSESFENESFWLDSENTVILKEDLHDEL
ncbi:hypothetical protein DXB15_00885 [Roseburia sp. OM02-15]|nr:hypothetical protein DXB15_00885 [Roseburia sp. OM02-15]